jgi:hypothetical protein
MSIEAKFKEFLERYAVEEMPIEIKVPMDMQKKSDKLHEKLLKLLPQSAHTLLMDYEDALLTEEAERSVLCYLKGVEDASKLLNFLNGKE